MGTWGGSGPWEKQTLLGVTDHRGCRPDQDRPRVLSPPTLAGPEAPIPAVTARPLWTGCWGGRGLAWICGHTAGDAANAPVMTLSLLKDTCTLLLRLTAMEGPAPGDKDNQITMVSQI